MVTVLPEDITLVTQPVQRRHLMLQVLNRDFNRLFNIEGYAISASSAIDESSDIRRTASLSMRVSKITLEKAVTLNMNHYVKIYAGIENNRTRETKWYCQGTFIINKNGLNLSLQDRTLSVELSDKMLDLTGGRRGKLHAYETIIAYGQRFDDVMKNLVYDLGGCQDYMITPIHPTRTQSTWYDATRNQDYLIPMKMDFSVGVSIYEILAKLKNVYANWEIFFDTDGTYICQAKLRDKDDSAVVMDDEYISKLKISDSSDIFDVSKIKNYIEVWGKDGSYYAEARDTNPDSPFTVAAVGEIREVFSGGDYENCYDRYKDLDLYQEQITEQASIKAELAALDTSTPEGQAQEAILNVQLADNEAAINSNIKYYGNDLAQEWADSLLNDYTRLQNTSTLTLILCPFLNETGFKIAYRNEAYNKVMTYVVTAVSHDYVANTTTLTCARFYDDNTQSMQMQLDTPVVDAYSVSENTVSITVEPVENATRYYMYLDNRLVTSDSSTTVTYTFSGDVVGEHTLSVAAGADNYEMSDNSEAVTIALGNLVLTQDGDCIITENNEGIEYEDGE